MFSILELKGLLTFRFENWDVKRQGQTDLAPYV